MGEERDAWCESGSDPVCMAYGLISKGNGEVILSKEKHTFLSVGGGQAGQGYPCVMILTLSALRATDTDPPTKAMDGR
jgi:DNA (cytosine-5)-methyltransferase 1